MKIVNYTSSKLLDCACTPNAPAIACVPSYLTGSGAPFLDVTILSATESGNMCGVQGYVYSLWYNEADLIDPGLSLTTSDMTGLFCKDCLVEYINFRTGN